MSCLCLRKEPVNHLKYLHHYVRSDNRIISDGLDFSDVYSYKILYRHIFVVNHLTLSKINLNDGIN